MLNQGRLPMLGRLMDAIPLFSKVEDPNVRADVLAARVEVLAKLGDFASARAAAGLAVERS